MFTSCRTQRAIYNYLEDYTDSSSLRNSTITEPLIQKNDLLSIQITSASLDPQTDALYNQQVATGATQNTQLQGYLVDQKGNIELPRIGTIRAEGLTKVQLSEVIKTRLQGILTNPSVVIRFLNFRVIVLGEVGSPGVQTVNVENLTLLEGLALAGDIRETGKKKEVKVLRELNGKRHIGIVDVTTTKMFESPYYQLQQNDVVMVERTRFSVRQTEQGRFTQQLGLALSIITSIALLYNIFR
jgi:polysaccharide export outer membrane protein